MQRDCKQLLIPDIQYIQYSFTVISFTEIFRGMLTILMPYLIAFKTVIAWLLH